MSRRSPLFAVAVVAVALLAIAVAASASPAGAGAGPSTSAVDSDTPDEQPDIVGTDVQPRIVDVPNTTNYLMPAADPQRQGYTATGVDVGSAVASSSSRLESSYRQETVRNRYESTEPGSEARVAALQTTVEAAERRVDRLDAEQETLFRAYSNGEISRTELVHRLAQLNVRAGETRATLQQIRELVRTDATTTLPPELDTRISKLQSELVLLPAPLSDRLTASVEGESAPMLTYVGAVDDALVLGAVEGDQFYRQATVRSEYNGPGSTNISEAFDRVTELYPWVYSGGEQFAPTFGPDSTGIGLYRLEATHPQGRLTAFLSGSTNSVFHESQTMDVDEVPITNDISATNGSLNLSVMTTTETGPMRVVVRDNATGAPTNATLFIDDEAVAATGDDGTLWLTRKAGPFDLTVRRDGDSVRLGRGYFFR